MEIVGFDRRLNGRHIHHARRILRQGLRLDAAQHRRATAFKTVGVRQLPHDVFIAALAMRHQAAQIALRARRRKQRRLLAQHGSDLFLQGVYGRVVAIHIVAQRGGHHRLAHGGRGLGNGVAA